MDNGRICYIEIPTDDVALSEKFYTSVFGWKLRTRGDGVTAFDDANGSVSGAWVQGRSPHGQLGVLVYIMVENIDDAVRAVERNGGKIVPPVGMDAPELTARFADPAGNIFGLYEEPRQTE